LTALSISVTPFRLCFFCSGAAPETICWKLSGAVRIS
jgi:hypothetical protein